VQKDYSRINNVCLVILASVAVVVALIFTKKVMIPFVIALFIFAAVSPFVRWLRQRLNVPKTFAILISVFLFLLLASIVVLLILNSLQGFIESAGVYKEKVIAFVVWAKALVGKFGVDINEKPLRETIVNLPIFSMAKNVSGGFFSVVGNTLLIIIFTIFMIAGEGVAASTNELMVELKNKVSRYISVKLLLSFVTAALVTAVLMICKVELAVMFGIFTFLLNFIPSIGSIFSVALPLPVVLLQYGFGWQFAVVLILPGIIQFVIGNIIDPKMMGETMGLHPVTILLFLIFWGLVWGIPGMFLSVPITAIMKIVFSRIETTQPLAHILSGKLPKV